jgi:DNA-3-methyladenine glycosylase
MPTRINALPASFYNRPTLQIAEELLGKVLVHRTPEGIASGMIVETEAYIGEDDPACHAAPGPTRRNAPLYGPPGLSYVYLNYGIHYLVNAVTEAEGHPAAVLIRALSPIDGVPLMVARRSGAFRRMAQGSGLTAHGGPARPNGVIAQCDLCRGPGNLTRALGVAASENGLDLSASRLTIEDRALRVCEVSRGPRIGIRVGVDRPWRFWITDHPAVSGQRRGAPVLR